MEVRLGKASDLDKWMTLVQEVKDNFPGLETDEALKDHRATVLEFIHNKNAICATDGGDIVGVLLFSMTENMLCFLAVSEKYRRQHIAEKMVEAMLELLPKGKNISVSTYRDGVLEGVAARAFYKRMGFQEGELTEEFGNPVQIFTLPR